MHLVDSCGSVSAGVVLIVLSLPSVSAAEKIAPDLVILDANIITVDDENPRAEALAIKGDKIALVGSTAEIRQSVGKSTVVIEARGKTVTPGFIDAHCHPRAIYGFESPHFRVDLSPKSVKTVADLIEALKQKAKITPRGRWVRGSRYQDTKLGRHPTRRDLDRASAVHPIHITHSSGHVSVVSSLALKAAGITRDTPDPAGGAFDRDEGGEPNGICRESAASSMVLRAGPSTPPPTRDERLAGLRTCFRNFVGKGITSVGHAGAGPSTLRLYQEAVNERLPVRIYLMMRERYLGDLEKLGLKTGFGSDRLRIGAIKMFHGNSLSGRTCWLYAPYADRADYYGIPPARSQHDLDELIFAIHEAGFQAAVHSNGDREIDMVLNAFERALNRLPRRDHRHRIEHCSVTNASILKRVKKLGVVLVLHSYVYEHGDKMEAYGEGRWGMMHPNRSALDLGIPVAGNSDYSVSAADPLLRIQSMVTRRAAEGKVYGAEQRISPEEAIRVWTLGSAFASFEETIKGSIEVGKLADLVILSGDPTSVPSHAIKDILVEKTIVGGEVVYESE